MIIYNAAAFGSAFYAVVYLGVFAIFFSMDPLFVSLSFVLGDITLRSGAGRGGQYGVPLDARFIEGIESA
jgi:hypothetical protein